MPQRAVEIPTEDGTCPASLHVPAGEGPWPAVIMFPDAGSLRPAFREMGEHLAGLGYVTLVPDLYYRHIPYAPFDVQTVFGDPPERERLMGLLGSLTAEVAASDARAYVDYLLALPETTGDAVGTTGYCIGGRISLTAATYLRDKIAAAASFHGGGIANESDPDSPHFRAAEITATVYVAGAIEDGSFTDEQRALLEKALTDSGVAHTIETYPGHHGFAVSDNGPYDPACQQRHWDALANLYGSTL